MVDNKTPPNNKEVEQKILCGLFMKPELLNVVSGQLETDDFYQFANRNIFEAMKMIHKKGDFPDLVTVKEQLKNSKKLEDSGGAKYLASLINLLPSIEEQQLISHLNIIRDLSTRRRLIEQAKKIELAAYDGQNELSQIFELVEATRGIESNTGTKKPYEAASDHVAECSRLIEDLAKGSEVGLKSGFIDIDSMIGGMIEGNLIVIAGRPSMGKTALATNISINVSKNKPVLIFSLESSMNELIQRMAFQISKVDSQNIKNYRLPEDDWRDLTKAFAKISESKIFINDEGNFNPYDLTRISRIFRHEKGEIGLVVVDYLQLMSAGIKTENRTQEVSVISRHLKLLAKEMDCPVIALSQLSRKVEDRTDKRPHLTDLRDSGSIEQDADIIMLIYRDEYYNSETKQKNIAEINIAKQRNGRTGTIELTFLSSSACFLDKYKY